MRSVVAYCRTACEPQGGPSPARRQAQAIRRYAKRRGLSLRSIYTDAGASGATLKRPALQRLIEDCRAGKVGKVVTKDPRAAVTGHQPIIRAASYLRVRVQFSAREGRSDRFLEIVLSAVAEFEGATARSNPP